MQSRKLMHTLLVTLLKDDGLVDKYRSSKISSKTFDAEEISIGKCWSASMAGSEQRRSV